MNTGKRAKRKKENKKEKKQERETEKHERKTEKQGKKQKRVSIAPGIELIDHAVWLPAQKLLALTDTHIGYEEALSKEGIMVPRLYYTEMVERVHRIVAEIERDHGSSAIDIILVNGDLKHEFGTISDQEWRETLQFLDLLGANARSVIIVRGNHDTIIGPVVQKRNVQLVDYFVAGKTVFIHGNVIPEHFDEILEQKGVETVVIGNEHPAVSIGTTLRREKYKCFLKGTYKGTYGKREKTLIVLPSFNTLAEGTDMTREKVISPFIEAPGDCEVYVIDEYTGKHRCFGKIKAIKPGI